MEGRYEQDKQDGGRKRITRSYAYYADACKEKGIPLTYERSSKNHDRGQVKTKEALRQCLYQKERDGPNGPKVVVKVVKMVANPLYSPSVKENPLFSNRSSLVLSSLGSVKSGKSDKSKKKVHDNLAFEMMQGNPMFEKKGKSKSK